MTQPTPPTAQKQVPAKFYSTIGTPFGKLPTYQKKPILLADVSLQKAYPFLKGIKAWDAHAGHDHVYDREHDRGRGVSGGSGGSRTLVVNKILEDSVIEEMIEEVFQTVYVVSMTYQGVGYFVRISDRKEGWLILAVERGPGQPKFWSSKRAILFGLLLLISAVGYYLEFGGGGILSPSNRDGNSSGGGGLSSNPTVYEAYLQESGAGGGVDDVDTGQTDVGTVPSGQGEKVEGNVSPTGVGNLPSVQGEGGSGMNVGQSPVGTIPSDPGGKTGVDAGHSNVNTIPASQGAKVGVASGGSPVGTVPSGQVGQSGGSSEIARVGSGPSSSATRDREQLPPDRVGEYPKAAQSNTQQGARQGAQPTAPAQSAKQPTQPGNPGNPLSPNQPKSASPSNWVQEKVQLQKEIDRLKRENEKLRNSLKQLQKTP